MVDIFDKEIEAIKTLLVVLEPLEPDVRKAVLVYVLKRLDITLPDGHAIAPVVSDIAKMPEPVQREQPSPSSAPTKQQDIRQLKEEKKPKSAIEMAVVVSYYLTHVAPKGERKETVCTNDLDKYFKMAQFRLPKSIAFTLPNTKKAGYLEPVGAGEYKLNPVGYNLVVHSMPRSEKASSRAQNRSKTNKKAAKGKK